MINKNARESDVCTFSAGWFTLQICIYYPRAPKKYGNACVCELEVSVTEKHTQMVCVEGNLWE